MKTNCWRCKALFDTSQVDTVETVGLCQKCWDKSSINEPTPPLPSETFEAVRQRIFDSVKVPKEHLGYIGSPEELAGSPGAEQS